MKFLNNIEDASKLTQDSLHRLVTDVMIAAWNAKADGSHKHTKSQITDFPSSLPADGGNAATVGGFTVGKSVPANADFANTITTVNGKTGAISKADIVALGIPAQDTTYSIATTSANGLMSSTDKQNLDENTTSRHTHINKAVIDKFTEVDDKPYYNGEEIGGGISAIIKSEEIISTEGQTVFTLTKGNYAPNENKLAIYIWGVKQHNNAFIETSTTSFTLSSGLKEGDRVIAEWFETSPSIKGDKGEKGTDGKDGYTPQKGVDYYTDADKAEMVSAVLAALPVYEGEVESV